MAWLLYYLSLIPLFGYLIIKYFDKALYCIIVNKEFCNITYGHYAFLVSLLLFFISIIAIAVLRYRSRSSFEINGAKIVSTPQNINHELIGVLSVVVLPFLTVNFDTINEIAASLFMLVIIGIISTQSSIYYKNPVLALLFLKLYQIEVEHRSFDDENGRPENKVVIVISFRSLTKNDSLYLKEMGKDVYFVKKTNNE